ncbi:MAG: hypothetical protein ACFBSG_05735 [Leptolyngbyaceae cyanobacterium]
MAFKKRLLLIGLTILCWWGLTVAVAAQGTSLRLESRVDRLEAELSRVRSRLNQVEARNNIPPSTPSATPGLNEPSLEEQFDNLATLAIELKQDVRQLEVRITELESE